ncbi:UDP-glycosyltransferase family 303 member A1 [Carabus blaptoides fortunei]
MMAVTGLIEIMTSKYFVSRILALFTLGNMCQCANILYLSTVPSPSHNIWDKTLAMGLAGRNHKITYFTHSPEKPTENFTPIFVEGMYERLAQKFDYIEWVDYSTITNIKECFGFVNMTCVFDLESKALQTLLAQAKNGVKYDLIIIDQNAGHCLYPLIDMFGSPPVIGTSPFGLAQYYTFAYGINLNIAYNPILLQPLTDKMSLWERANNFFYTMVYLYLRQYDHMPAQQKLAEEFFGKDIRPLHEVEKTFSLLLTNTDPMVARKLGVQLDYKNITSKSVLSAINEVRDNEVYKKNAQAISRYYRDKPQDALETAIFWVEYVLRHGGAEHLSIAARDMPFYQLLLLDILAIVTLTVLLVIFLVKQVIKSVKRKQKVKKH